MKSYTSGKVAQNLHSCSAYINKRPYIAFYI